MAEQVFEKLQIGRETTEGTGVAATKIYPTDPGVFLELDRAYVSPEEDFAGISGHMPSRASYGLRSGGLSWPGILTYEGPMDLFEMCLAGSITPSGAGTDKTWVYLADHLTDTLRGYTLEAGDEFQAWRIPGAIVTELTLSFDTLTVPGESPWRYAATVVGRDRQPVTFTPALAAPPAGSFETIEGHLTRIYEGTTATAFGSLAELAATLASYSVTIPNPAPLRGYGSASDLATGRGRQRRRPTFEARLKQSASTKTNIQDIFNATGALVGERRWKIEALGNIVAGSAVARKFSLEHRVRFNSINFEDRDGERVYVAAGDLVYDATNASDIKATIINGQTAVGTWT
jgi:hypothetical protein